MSDTRDRAYVSTGALPPAALVAELVREAHALHRGDSGGEVSEIYPALARVDPDLFGIAVVGATGAVFSEGDADVPFAIMSVAKPFVFALAHAGRLPRSARRLGPTG
jgi:glutaminase